MDDAETNLAYGLLFGLDGALLPWLCFSMFVLFGIVLFLADQLNCKLFRVVTWLGQRS